MWSSFFSMCQGFAAQLPPGGSILKHCSYFITAAPYYLAFFLWFLEEVSIEKVGMVT